MVLRTQMWTVMHIGVHDAKLSMSRPFCRTGGLGRQRLFDRGVKSSCGYKVRTIGTVERYVNTT